MTESMTMLTSINELLTHIKEVEEDTIRLSRESMLILGNFIEKQGVALDEESAQALQYQDIIAQQLSATIEAIESVQQSITIFENAFASDEKLASDSMQKLHNKLGKSLSHAKERRAAFLGRLGDESEEEIEFF